MLVTRFFRLVQRLKVRPEWSTFRHLPVRVRTYPYSEARYGAPALLANIKLG